MEKVLAVIELPENVFQGAPKPLRISDKMAHPQSLGTDISPPLVNSWQAMPARVRTHYSSPFARSTGLEVSGSFPSMPHFLPTEASWRLDGSRPEGCYARALLRPGNIPLDLIPVLCS
jgi:hypothetical protein